MYLHLINVMNYNDYTSSTKWLYFFNIYILFCQLESVLIATGKQVGLAQVSGRQAPRRLRRNWGDSCQACLHLTLTRHVKSYFNNLIFFLIFFSRLASALTEAGNIYIYIHTYKYECITISMNIIPMFIKLS